ncbi:MAG: hypothetical protein ABI353_08115 [Isosphaeraceae bacterium]
MRTRRLPRRFQPALDVLPDRISPTDFPFLAPPTDGPGLMVPPVMTIPGGTPGDDVPMPDSPPEVSGDTASTSDVVGADNYAFWMWMGPI